MKTESRILADTRIQKLEPFLNGYRGFLQLRCGKQRAFTFCATRDISEDGSTYEHVSVGLVSSKTKTPTLFWNEDEEVHQVHPAAKDYLHGVGTLKNVLHLWRPEDGWKW